MRVEPLGDRGFVLRELPGPPAALAQAIRDEDLGCPIEATVSYETIGVYAHPEATIGELRTLQSRLEGLQPRATATAAVGRTHRIPICYAMGLDLEEAAIRLDITPEALIEAHCSSVYECFAVGFCPGFAYLGDLDPRIAGLPRRDVPRVRVEPGSLGITGRQTGVYPLARPGGWWLIGRCPLELVNMEDAYFPIAPGDRVRFYPIDEEEFGAQQGQRFQP